jgi:hypothetical protein
VQLVRTVLHLGSQMQVEQRRGQGARPRTAPTLPVVISDTDAVYVYGLDIIAEQLAGADRYYYMHDGLGSVRQLLDSSGHIATRYAYDPFGVPLSGDGVPNPWRFTREAWDA